MPDQAFTWGLGIGIVLTLLLVLRWPAFREKVLGLTVFGRPIIKSLRR